MEGKKNIEIISTWIIIILFSVGIIGHSISQLRNLMILLTPITLSITTVIVLFNILKEKRSTNFNWILAVVLFTLAIEIWGVKTKLIFGDYEYGNVLGIKIFDVPIIIGFNWALIILGAIQISEKYIDNKYIAIIVASFLAVLFDFILEPVAVKLVYWSWKGNNIPVQNYVAWFVISLLASFLYFIFKMKINSSLPKIYFIVQIIFFSSLLILL